MKRVHPSGALKKKKSKKGRELIEKIPKVTSYFRVPVIQSPCPAASCTANRCNQETPSSESELLSIQADPVITPSESAPVENLSNNDTEPSKVEVDCEIFDNLDYLLKQHDPHPPKVEVEPSSDAALWDSCGISKNKLQEYWIRKGPSHCQNIENEFEESIRVYNTTKDGKTLSESRKCHTNFFFKELKNDEKVKRNWFIYSPSTGKVFCFACKLFG